MGKTVDKKKVDESKVTIGDLLQDGHAPGALVLLLTIPNMIIIPSVPVLPFLCGIPSILIMVGMIVGSDHHLLPAWCLKFGLSRKSVERCMRLGRTVSFLARDNRMSDLLKGWSLTLVCSMGIVLTFVTCLPIPILNQPAGFSCLLLSIGLARRDGLLSWLGVLAGIPSLIFLYWASTHVWSMTEYMPIGMEQP